MAHLGVFARYWNPGTVKTRLARRIGPLKSAALYRHFVEQTVSRHLHGRDNGSLWVSPSSQCHCFQAIAAGIPLFGQSGEDLGARMQHFFETMLSRHDSVVLIGTDTPDLPAQRIEVAIQHLSSCDLVLGPAVDGGYYLIGMTRAASPSLSAIFQEVAWSTSSVLESTFARAASARLKWQLLPEYRDVDTMEDLQNLSETLTARGNLEQRDRLLGKWVQWALDPDESSPAPNLLFPDPV